MSTGSPAATAPKLAPAAPRVSASRVAPYGKSEAQSDAYATFTQHHLINGLGRSQRLAQERVDMILNGSAYQVQARIVHDTIMAAKGAGL